MNAQVVANTALVIGVVAILMGGASVMMCLYMIGQTSILFKMWAQESPNAEPSGGDEDAGL